VAENAGARSAIPDRAATTYFHLTGSVPPHYPRGGDPRRRLRWHHVFLRRRRWSRELDEIGRRLEVAA